MGECVSTSSESSHGQQRARSSIPVCAAIAVRIRGGSVVADQRQKESEMEREKQTPGWTPSRAWIALQDFAVFITLPTTTPEQAAEARRRTMAVIDTHEGRVPR